MVTKCKDDTNLKTYTAFKYDLDVHYFRIRSRFRTSLLGGGLHLSDCTGTTALQISDIAKCLAGLANNIHGTLFHHKE